MVQANGVPWEVASATDFRVPPELHALINWSVRGPDPWCVVHFSSASLAGATAALSQRAAMGESPVK